MQWGLHLQSWPIILSLVSLLPYSLQYYLPQESEIYEVVQILFGRRYTSPCLGIVVFDIVSHLWFCFPLCHPCAYFFLASCSLYVLNLLWQVLCHWAWFSTKSFTVMSSLKLSGTGSLLSFLNSVTLLRKHLYGSDLSPGPIAFNGHFGISPVGNWQIAHSVQSILSAKRRKY